MIKEFICKGCGEKLKKDMQSSNVDYCYICNEFYMKKYVSDLEAKLAEKQSKIQELNDMYEDLLVAKGTENELMQVSADCEFFAQENRKLKQQLAEKEELINEYADSLSKVLIEKADLAFKHNQDKISFCIEQLEKVKDLYKKHLDYERVYDEFRVMRLEEDIETLINELKEKK